MFEKQKTMLYFAPHQDDELLTMGIDICHSLAKKWEVHVILCTDGSRSNVRRRLNNGQTCSKHPGKHVYELTEQAFTEARDREFRDSCLALGVKESNIHIPKNRDIDGSLKVQTAEAIIRQYISAVKGEVTLCTISCNNGPDQHPDHKALGKAAERLLDQGIVKELRLFVEPYLFDKIAVNSRMIPIAPTIRTPSAQVAEKVKKAIAAYSYWNPEKGRYAVGFHSVTTEFEDFLEKLTCYCFPKWREQDMTRMQWLNFQHRKWKKLYYQKQLYYSMPRCSKPQLEGVRFLGINPQDTDHYRELCALYHLKLREKDLQRLTDGSYFGCLVTESGEVAATGWLAYRHRFYIGETDFAFDMSSSNTAIFYDFNTMPEHRGRGYQGKLMQSLACSAEGPDRFISYTAPDNFASQKGMQKAGLTFEGTLSASDNSMVPYLRRAGFTNIHRKYQLWGLKVLP